MSGRVQGGMASMHQSLLYSNREQPIATYSNRPTAVQKQESEPHSYQNMTSSSPSSPSRNAEADGESGRVYANSDGAAYETLPVSSSAAAPRRPAGAGPPRRPSYRPQTVQQQQQQPHDDDDERDAYMSVAEAAATYANTAPSTAGYANGNAYSSVGGPTPPPPVPTSARPSRPNGSSPTTSPTTSPLMPRAAALLPPLPGDAVDVDSLYARPYALPPKKKQTQPLQPPPVPPGKPVLQQSVPDKPTISNPIPLLTHSMSMSGIVTENPARKPSGSSDVGILKHSMSTPDALRNVGAKSPTSPTTSSHSVSRTSLSGSGTRPLVESAAPKPRTLSQSLLITTPRKASSGSDKPLPLPPGWAEAVDPNSGRTYYIDHVNKVTSWVDPRDEFTKPKTFEDCNGDQLPFGWESLVDPQVGAYFIDHNSRTTQLEDPRRPDRHKNQSTMLKEYVRLAEENLLAERAKVAETNAAVKRSEAAVAQLVTALIKQRGEDEDLKQRVAAEQVRLMALRESLRLLETQLKRQEQTFELLAQVEKKMARSGVYRLEDARLAFEETAQIKALIQRQRQETEELKLLCAAGTLLDSAEERFSAPDLSALSDDDKQIYKNEILNWLVANAVNIGALDEATAKKLQSELDVGRVHIALSAIGDTLMALLPSIALLEEVLIIHGTRLHQLREAVRNVHVVSVSRVLNILILYSSESELVQTVISLVDKHVGDVVDVNGLVQFVSDNLRHAHTARSVLTAQTSIPIETLSSILNQWTEQTSSLRYLLSALKRDIILCAPPIDITDDDMFVAAEDNYEYVYGHHKSIDDSDYNPVYANQAVPIVEDDPSFYSDLAAVHDYDYIPFGKTSKAPSVATDRVERKQPSPKKSGSPYISNQSSIVNDAVAAELDNDAQNIDKSVMLGRMMFALDGLAKTTESSSSLSPYSNDVNELRHRLAVVRAEAINEGWNQRRRRSQKDQSGKEGGRTRLDVEIALALSKRQLMEQQSALDNARSSMSKHLPVVLFNHASTSASPSIPTASSSSSPVPVSAVPGVTATKRPSLATATGAQRTVFESPV